MNKLSKAALYIVAVLNVFAIWMMLSGFLPEELRGWHYLSAMLPIVFTIHFLNTNLKD